MNIKLNEKYKFLIYTEGGGLYLTDPNDLAEKIFICEGDIIPPCPLIPHDTKHTVFTIGPEGNWVSTKLNLPTNIRNDYQWVAMEPTGAWYVYEKQPKKVVRSWSGSGINLATMFPPIGNDPYGWEKSLHKRNEDGSWSRA